MMRRNSTVTLKELEMEAASLRKKIFIYETLQAEKEVRQKKVNGPFKSGAELIKSLKP